jgi:hypothetical protein
MQAQVLSVVRGERSWRDLRRLGLDISRRGSTWHFGASPDRPLRVSASDLQEGLTRALRNENAGREWAGFVLAASSLIDLEALESEEEGENILNCLWDLSIGDTQSTREVLSRKGIVG